MSNDVIIVGLNGRPSMREVYRNLKGAILVETHPSMRYYIENRGWKTQFLEPEIPATMPSIFNGCTLIRWGCTHSVSGVAKEINPASGIARASTKGRARSMMHQAGVRVPKPIDRFNYLSANYPLIWRPEFHNKGKDFHVIESPEILTRALHMSDFRNYFTQGYLSEFVDKDREFRAHIAGGKVIAMSEKPPQEGMKWNEVEGQEFFEIDTWPEDVAVQAIKAVKALGLDSGGVDVILQGDEASVLEINTAPTLYKCKFEVDAYTKWFQSIIDG